MFKRVVKCITKRNIQQVILTGSCSQEAYYHRTNYYEKDSIPLHHHTHRNQLISATNDDELNHMRQLASSLYEPKTMTPVQSKIFNWKQESDHSENKVLNFRNGLTFTPYAFARICNANCRFCSENLERMKDDSSKKKMNSYPTKRIKDYDQYFEGLEKSFEILETIQKENGSLNMGLSLSGLEATSEPVWFERLCHLLERYPNLFDEKVLYSNGSGFALYADEMVRSLKNLDFDRIELSRQHFNEEVNQKIMRFEKAQPVRLNDIYEKVTTTILPRFFKVVKNSCILTKAGISNIEQVEEYLKWAMSLGVQRVVFRELSVIGNEGYDNQNKTKLWIDENRVTISSVLSQVAPKLSQIRKDFSYNFTTIGYYYMNESYRYKDSIDVIFETSSYEALASSLDKYPNVVNKLIFHPNGNLTSDWEQDSKIIGKFFK